MRGGRVPINRLRRFLSETAEGFFFDTRRIIQTDRISGKFLRDPDFPSFARIRARIRCGKKRRFHADGLRQIHVESFSSFRPDRARDDDPSSFRVGKTGSDKPL